MRSLRLRSCKRRAHSPLRLHGEARLILGARASSHNQQTQQQIQRYLGARTLCPRTCQRATPATRRSPVHCTWPSIAPTAVPPHVIRPRLATAGPRDISCETLCNRQPLLLTVFLATRRRKAPNAGCRCRVRRQEGERTLKTALSISAHPHLAPCTLRHPVQYHPCASRACMVCPRDVLCV